MFFRPRGFLGNPTISAVWKLVLAGGGGHVTNWATANLALTSRTLQASDTSLIYSQFQFSKPMTRGDAFLILNRSYTRGRSQRFVRSTPILDIIWSNPSDSSIHNLGPVRSETVPPVTWRGCLWSCVLL